ncbi:MAG TPA: glycosyltransferase family 39 protein [Pirellulales bacterium]|nr:glycosyltransferase family 39 protein [Pirellulales bacterium]
MPRRASAPSGWFALTAEWLLAALCLSPLLLLPLARDQGHFAYAGQVILDGGLPYRDVFDQKGPATHYTFALALALFGQTAWGVRCFFFFAALLTTRLAAVLGQRLAGHQARLPCVLAMALALVQGDEGTAWHSGQVEDLLLVLQLAAVYLYGGDAAQRSRWRTALAAGLLGLACTYKPTALLPSVVLLAIAGAALLRGDPAARLSCRAWLACSLGGFVLPPFVAIGYLAARGAFDDFWMVVIDFNSAYAELKSGFAKGTSMLVTRWGRLTVLASWGALAVRTPSAKSTDRLLWGLAIANLAMVAWQGKYWPYHWTPFVGCLAIFAGLSAAQVAAELAQRLGRWSPMATPVMLALLIAAVPVDLQYLSGMWRGAVRVAAGRESLDTFRARFNCGAVDADVHRQAAEYIRSRTSPGETMLVWGYETVVNFLADRRAPTRFAVDRILCLEGFKRQSAWRAEFLHSLGQKPPAYIVVVDHNGTSIWRESTEELQRFPEFHDLVSRDYVEETRFDRLRLYHWRGGSCAPNVAEDGLPRPSRLALDGLGRPSSDLACEDITSPEWIDGRR